MREKIEELVRQALADAQAAGELPELQIDDVGLERPQDSSMVIGLLRLLCVLQS